MPNCKQCGKKINYIKVGKKNVMVEQKEIEVFVTGTQTRIKGHPTHKCEGAK